VEEIFHVPLEMFLHIDDSLTTTRATGQERLEGVKHSFEDLEWLEKKLYRLHEFTSPSFPNPITGLTADILISTALLAHYGLTAEEDWAEEGKRDGKVVRLGFERRAKGQLSWESIVVVALANQGFGEKGLIFDRKIST
jgi:hypothetical protein